MKINWGTGIFLFYAVFVGLSIAFVIFSMGKEVNLVTEDYYGEELKFQNKIDIMERSLLAKVKPEIIFENNKLIIQLPDSTNKFKLNGNIHFYRPSDNKLDFKIPVQLSSENITSIDLSGLKKGKWEAHLSWFDNELEFYTEKTFMVN